MNNRRLIEEPIPLHAISEQSAREKPIRHIWWRRRPDALQDLELIRGAGIHGLEPAFQLLESALDTDIESETQEPA